MLKNKSGNRPISETRKDRGKVTIGTQQRSFERCHSRPPTASPSPRLGVRNPHSKLQFKIARKRVHRYVVCMVGIGFFFLGRGGERGHVGIARTEPFLASGYLPPPRLLTQEQVKLVSYGLQMWQVHSQDASELKPIKNFGEKAAWAYPGSPGLLRFLGTPYYLRNG